MSETKQCPKCQAEIPAGAPEGLCPSCLLKAGLQPNSGEAEPKTAAYTPTGSGFVPPPPEELQPAFPQLEILELLGKGGMGAVYKAKQRGLDRLVAVKILPPEYSQDPAFAERFMREAKALAMLSHPNIVGVHDVGQAGGFCYFVMEYVDGVNLRQAMRSGELKSAEALKIVPQICDALQFAHDEGIVHRDIKPENILLDKKGRVKIADFGLAKLLGKTAPDLSLTGTQQVMGTLHYMAPEQFEGSRNVDHRADIYSLGVTFYEMLTGELPIGRFAVPSKKVQIDVRLDEVVLRSLEKEPEQRYQHASEIKTEVEGIVRTPSSAGAGPTADEPPSLKPQLNAGICLLIIGVACIPCFGAFWGKDNFGGGVVCGFVSVSCLALGILNIVLYLFRSATRPAAAQRGPRPGEIKMEVESVAGTHANRPAPPPTAARSPSYLRSVLIPVLALCGTWLLSAVVGTATGHFNLDPYSTAGKPWVAAAIWLGILIVILHGVWLYRKFFARAVANYLDSLNVDGTWMLWNVLLPVLVAAGAWTASWFAVAFVIGEDVAYGAALCTTLLSLLTFWVHRKFGLGIVRPYLPYIWTILCAVLFVTLWTPYEANRASWSGYLDGGIWPYREINECAISLEPIVPTCKRIVIREKTELALSGNPNAHKGSRQPDVHRTTRLTYDIEMQPGKSSRRRIEVDTLDGMSWNNGGQRETNLDAVTLAGWLRLGDEGHLGNVGPEEAHKKRLAALTLQARAVMDIIQRASRDQYVFTYAGSREFGKRTSRLENAADMYARTVFRNEAFVPVPGWNAAESVKVEPVVPIVYVGVPIMLAVWAIGVLLLLLMLRRQPANNRKVGALKTASASHKIAAVGPTPQG